jgi:hypothetical protein
MVKIDGAKITLTEGKYKGQLLSKVCEIDPEYVVNCEKRNKFKALKDEPGHLFIKVAVQLAKKDAVTNVK